MRNIKILPFFILLFFSSVLADSKVPQELVDSTVKEVQKVVREATPNTPPEKTEELLRTVISPVFDFDEMAKRCLGVNWKSATPSEQKTFTDLFSDLLADNYLKQIRQSAGNSEFQVINSNEEKGKAVVQTKVITEKDTIKIDYRLYNRNSTWKIYDVIIENIGLVSNYRSEFSEIIQKEKMSGLIEKLKDKVKKK